MIEVSTKDQKRNDASESGLVESLSSEEDEFFTTVQSELGKISFSPSTATIEKILSYSKSL